MKRLIAALLLLTLLTGLVPSGLGEDEITYTGTVSTASLHLRREPSASAKVINTYKRGKEVTVLANDGTWCRVQVGKNTGYMMTQYLDIKANYDHLGWGKTPDDGTVLNLRSGAGTGASVVYKAMSGTIVELVQEQGAWYRVRLDNVFGWVERSRITPITGDFALGFSTSDTSENITAARMFSAVREFGSTVTMSRNESDFTYSIVYPSTGVSAADEKISAWVRSTLRTFEADYNQFHQGTKAQLSVEYQAVSVDSRYKSIVLVGDYQVRDWQVQTVLALNLDTQTGALLDNENLFSADPMRALFCLESAGTTLLSNPTDGYTGIADFTWLKYAALGRDGVQLFLPAGFYLPIAMGTRRMLMKYNQIGECLGVDSQAIRSYTRTIDPTRPMVALTFDDGPSEETDRILKVLAEYDSRATFCVIGNKVEEYADVIKRTIAGGNEIASHTWNHAKLTKLSAANIRSQLERTNDIVAQVTGGYQVKVLRPPYGSFNKTLRNVCAEMNMVIAEWELDTLDWNTRNANKTYNKIIKGVKNGYIVLCHDLYETTADAMERVIPELVDRGYQLVTVSELLSFHKDGAKAGTVYARVDPENMIGGE